MAFGLFSRGVAYCKSVLWAQTTLVTLKKLSFWTCKAKIWSQTLVTYKPRPMRPRLIAAGHSATPLSKKHPTFYYRTVDSSESRRHPSIGISVLSTQEMFQKWMNEIAKGHRNRTPPIIIHYLYIISSLFLQRVLWSIIKTEVFPWRLQHEWVLYFNFSIDFVY